MADTKLTVSMILNSASFTKQIQDVNKQLKLAESQFQNTSTGVDRFENTLEGAQSKLANLTTKLSLQNTKISKYRDEITKTKNDLDNLVVKYDKNKKKLDETNAAYDEAVQKYGKNSEQAKKLKEEITDLEKKQTNYENRIISTNSRLATLETELNNAELEAKKLGEQVDNAADSLNNFATESAKLKLTEMGNNLKEAGSRLEDIGKGFTEVGKKMATISIPLVGIGTASVKTAMTFEQGMSKVQAASGASAKDLELLEQKARDVAKTSTKSATDTVEALGNLALAGYDTQDMLNALDPVIKMAEAGMLDLETASDLCVNAMSTLGKGTDELEGFLDVIAQTANATTTDIDGMMEAFINVGSTVKGLNIPFQEAAAVLGVMGQNGTRGYEAGTKLNSIITRMTSQSKIASKAWSELGVSVFDGEGKFRGLTTVLNETRKKLKGYNDEQTQTFLKTVVGTDNINDFKNVLDSTGGTLEDLTNQLYNCDGALAEMTDIMKDNVAGQWANIKSQMEELGLKIADVLLPIFSDLLKSVSKVIEWFDKLPEPMQKFAVYAGIAFVATNTLIVGLGTLISAFGSTKSALGKMLIALASGEGGLASFSLKIAGKMGLTDALTSAGTAAATAGGATGLGALMGSLGSFALAATPYIAAAAAVAGAGYLIYEGLQQELIPSVDLFADKVETTASSVGHGMTAMATSVETEVIKISDATKEAVGAYIDMDDGIRQELFDMQVNSEVVTNDIASSLTTKFQNMGTQIKEGFKAHMEENTGILNTFFENSKVLSEAAEQDILLKTNEYYQQKIEDTETSEKRIAEIIENAKNEHRELTEQEMNEISSIQDTMRTNAVNALSKQELESKVIIERLKSYDERMTSEMVGNHIKELNKQRDSAKKSAEDTYTDTVRTITRMRDETGTITKAQADKLIKEAKRQRDESIEAAEELRDGAVQEISKSYSEISKNIDLETGNMITSLDRLKRWWNNWKPKEKTLSIINKVSEYILGGSPSKSSSSSKKPSKANYMPNVGEVSIEPINNYSTLSDSLYVPTARETSSISKTINSTTNPSVGAVSRSDKNTIVVDNSQELQTLIDLNQSLIGLVQKLINKDNNVYLDGKEVARGIAPYKSEIDKYDMRNPRFVY